MNGSRTRFSHLMSHLRYIGFLQAEHDIGAAERCPDQGRFLRINGKRSINVGKNGKDPFHIFRRCIESEAQVYDISPGSAVIIHKAPDILTPVCIHDLRQHFHPRSPPDLYTADNKIRKRFALQFIYPQHGVFCLSCSKEIVGRDRARKLHRAKQRRYLYEIIVLTRDMSRCTAPKVFAGNSHQASPNRVQLYVARRSIRCASSRT